MPIYEYRCQSCGKEIEVTQRIVDPPLKECPNCHQPALERLISNTSFLLKGSGWYKDGYGSKKETRSDNTVGDRMEKAIADDKKKAGTAEAAPASAPAASEPAASPSGGSSGSTSGASGSAGS